MHGTTAHSLIAKPDLIMIASIVFWGRGGTSEPFSVQLLSCIHTEQNWDQDQINGKL